MPRGLNKVMIIGNLGADPEMRYTPSGSAVASFRVAASRRWTTPEGEQRDATDWFNVVAWGRLAEICQQYLRRGQQIYIEGRLQTRTYQDQDGQTRYWTEVVARDMVMLGGRWDREEPGLEEEIDVDEIPF